MGENKRRQTGRAIAPRAASATLQGPTGGTHAKGAGWRAVELRYAAGSPAMGADPFLGRIGRSAGA